MSFNNNFQNPSITTMNNSGTIQFFLVVECSAHTDYVYVCMHVCMYVCIHVSCLLLIHSHMYAYPNTIYTASVITYYRTSQFIYLNMQFLKKDTCVVCTLNIYIYIYIYIIYIYIIFYKANLMSFIY